MSAALPEAFAGYIAIAVRRKWLIAGCILLSLASAWMLCQVLPKSYRSSTLILVENQKIPERYVQGVVSGSVQDKVSMVQQQVLSRTMLSEVIQEFDLYSNKDGKVNIESAIRKMRNSVRVETKGGLRVDSFSISFAHEDPVIAKRVVERLAAQFIEQNLRIREEFVEGASDFLEEELNASKKELETKEQAISQFKHMYMGELPGQLETNLRALDRLQAEIASLQESVPKLTEQVAMVEKDISEYKTRGVVRRPGVASGSPSQGSGDALHVRLKQLERQLTSLLAQYKDTYPDVIQTKEEIARVKAQLLLQPIPRERAAKQNTRTEFDPYLSHLVRQRDEIRLEMATLKDRQRRLSEQVRAIEGHVERTPAREQELMVLVRDYDNLQRNYQSLLDKQLNAKVAGNLERRQKGEQFRIIDPANLPGDPESPDRFKIMLAGLVLGCGVGCGLALALEQGAPAFHQAEEVEKLLGFPVLATIPSFDLTPKTDKRATLPKRRGGQPVQSYQGHGGGQRRIVQVTGSEPVFLPAIADGGGASAQGRFAGTRSLAELNLPTRRQPLSLFTEQFRVAATTLVLMASGCKSTVIVCTSAVKGEGKSTTACNLAYVLAQDLGKATLLIDCDLKRPKVHEYIGLKARLGLAEVLRGEASFDQCVHHVAGSTFWVLPAGRVEECPVPLARMHGLTHVLKGVADRFEFVLVDAPPILPMADMNVLSRMADILLLVVRAGVTRQEVVHRALHNLKPACQTGIILTGHKMQHMPYYMRNVYYASGDKAHGV